jgi:Trk K+ transport system NAD-binding subunit
LLCGQFRGSLIAFALLLTAGTVLLRFWYVDPASGVRSVSWSRAIHATFRMIFLETVLDFPDAPLALQLWFIATPLLGLAVVADGVIRFGVALFDRRERREAWQLAIASTYKDHIVVCGLGRVGYRVAKQLILAGEDVVGIEREPENPFLEEIQQLRVPVIIADARRRDALQKANVAQASSIVVCTEDDLTNLAIALDAREIKPNIKIVLRMFDSGLAEKVQRGFGIHTAFSTSALAAPVFAAAATHTQVDYSFYLGDCLMNLAHATIGAASSLVGRTVTDVEQEYGLSVVLHQRAALTAARPEPGQVLAAGDCLAVLASLDGLNRLNAVVDLGRDTT